jgi:CCR4-NOT transcription complex subunit 1
MQDVFFRVCTELAVESFLVSTVDDTTAYASLDAYSKLVMLLLRLTPAEQTTVKTVMLGRVLSALVKVLLRDHDDRGKAFDQRPYQRLLDTWLVELHAPEQQLTFDATNPPLITFGNLFVMLSPSRVPGFTFAWLELISHRMFMPKLLLSKSQKLWPFMMRLLVELLHFLDPHLRAADMSEPLRALYKVTTLSILLSHFFLPVLKY